MQKSTTCCFTGHRPEKLPWGMDETDPRCIRLKAKMDQVLETAYQKGMRHFICGMAQGSDLYFAEAVLKLRHYYPDVTLEAARPCETQARSWPEREQKRYQSILDQCNYETLVQHTYSPGCMQRRNRYMVDHAQLVIAVYNGEPKGGTAQTLSYALRNRRDTCILEPEEELL